MPRYDLWADGGGAHAVSACINGVIVLGLCAQWRRLAARATPAPRALLSLLRAEICFETVHGLCHARFDAFGGHCFDVQHVVGLVLVGALEAAVGALASGGAGQPRLLGVVLLADGALWLASAPQLARALVAFCAFSYLIARAARTKQLRAQPMAAAAATLMLLSSALFAAEGHFNCSERLPHARLARGLGLPPHAVFEAVGLAIFAATNRALIDGFEGAPPRRVAA